MSRLKITLLGPFQVILDGTLISPFKSNKVRALLAYLAYNADRPHRREVLAGLLWPERPDKAAFGNLRDALSNLRSLLHDGQPIGPGSPPPFFLVTRDMIQFNPASDYWSDATEFEQKIAAGLGQTTESHQRESALCTLQSAVTLYRGSFLEGFSVDSAAFEEWILLKGEQLERQMLAALGHLAADCAARGAYDQALTYVRRQLELESWVEETHQQLMRLLALNGQRSTALAQYDVCRRVVASKLGVELAAETVALYEAIRDGTMRGERRIQ